MPRSNITIRDVAHQAGVSHQTVSRVINGSDQVRPDTRKKVEEVIQDLGYMPNAIARSMARGRTYTLACLSPNLTDYTFAKYIEGAEAAARKKDYFVISASIPDEESFETTINQLVKSRRTEGLLLCNPFVEFRNRVLPTDVPIVFIGCSPESKKISSVTLDDFDVGYRAAEHLLTLQHKKIAMVTGPLNEKPTRERTEGFRSALNDFGVNLRDYFNISGDWTASSGYQALGNLLSGQETPTAIFAQNDRMAIGVLRKARESNLSVPDQLSVIGVDDMPLSSYFDPPLTTMRQDMAQLGQIAAEMLIDIISNKITKILHPTIKATLINRKSTRPL